MDIIGQMAPSSSSDSTKQSTNVSNISVEQHYSVSQSTSGGQFAGPTEEMSTAAKALVGRSTTLTDALKAASINVGKKSVENADVAAIKEVEARATGRDQDAAGGIAATAVEAVTHNEKVAVEDEEEAGQKMTLSDVVAEIDVKVKRDKSVTREDAEAVVEAELNNCPRNGTVSGGVAESVAAASKLNTNPSL